MSFQASLTNHNPENYHKHASFVFSKAYTAPVLQLLNPQPGERIIDLGCGTGELTRQLKDAVGTEGRTVGLDSSEKMIISARETSDQIEWIQGDIQKLSTTLDASYAGAFDAVFTSATLHWCRSDPAGAVESIKWLLKPGGRVAFDFGGFGNIAALHQVLKERGVDPLPLDPWYFPTAEQYASLLSAHSMKPGNIQLVPRPTPLTTDLYGWLTTFAQNTFLSGFPPEEADAMMKQVEDICRPDAFWSDDAPGLGRKGTDSSSACGWQIMYVRIRGIAYA